jgi:hypothetical protein
MNRELIEALAKARYLSKRNVGISNTRSDGSKCSIENDIQATGAEFFAAQAYNRPFDASIGQRGDGGSDFSLHLTIEVIWLGVDKESRPRTDGHLIVNPHEPQRWADIYIVIAGSIEQGFRELGWIPHKVLVRYPKQNFGFGRRFACHISKLKSPKALKILLKDI